MSRNGAAHWPTNNESCLRPAAMKPREAAIDPSARDRYNAEGAFEVTLSIPAVHWPSFESSLATRKSVMIFPPQATTSLWTQMPLHSRRLHRPSPKPGRKSPGMAPILKQLRRRKKLPEIYQASTRLAGTKAAL